MPTSNPERLVPGRGRLLRMAALRFGAGLIALLLLIFLPAGTTRYWQAWVYLATLFVPMCLELVYLLRHDPALLERRMRGKEREREQGVLIRLGSLCYVLVYVVAGLDRRFAWSEIPAAMVLAADLVILAGYALFARVLAVNSFASRVVAVEPGQRVVSTGPYAVVRHPMYVAILAMFEAAPVALGSWWALLPALPLWAIIGARARQEEQVLLRELPDYAAYVRRTRYRLIPGVW